MWVEAGSADECAVDLWLVEQGGGVVGLDAASVKDADGVGDVTAEAASDFAADEQMCGGGNLWRGGFAGADGPDRFIGYDDILGVFRRDSDERERDLLAQDFVGVIGFALGQVFADADDRGELVLERSGELLVDGLVGFVAILAAL